MSTVQLNLLPNVKLEYIKAKRQKRLVVVGALGVSICALLLVGALLFNVKVLQQHSLANLDKDISASTQRLQSNTQLNKVLTVQNQLNSLPTLEQQKPATSRLFTYLQQVTPSNVSITSLTADFSAHTMSVDVSTDSLQSVHDYIDILKFTAYKTSDSSGPVTCDATASTTCAFSNVVMMSFGYGDQAKGTSAFSTITFSFAPDIFDVSKQVSLVVPKGKVSPVTDVNSLFINDPNQKAKEAANTQGQ